MKSLAPRLLLSLGDGSAPAARAAAQLSRLRELPHISLPLAEAAALPPFALAWVGRLPFDALLRWNAAPLTIAMLISRGAASAARALDALGAAVFFGDAVRLKLHVHADAPRDALALAQRWEGARRARGRRGGGRRRRQPQASAVRHRPRRVPEGGGGADVARRERVAADGDDEVVVVLDDGAELSPYFYAVLKHFLLTADRAHLLGVAFGLPEAPPPDAPHDAAADAAAKGRRRPGRARGAVRVRDGVPRKAVARAPRVCRRRRVVRRRRRRRRRRRVVGAPRAVHGRERLPAALPRRRALPPRRRPARAAARRGGRGGAGAE